MCLVRGEVLTNSRRGGGAAWCNLKGSTLKTGRGRREHRCGQQEELCAELLLGKSGSSYCNLRESIVIRTHDVPKNPYVSLFLHTMLGPDYYVPDIWVRSILPLVGSTYRADVELLL